MTELGAWVAASLVIVAIVAVTVLYAALVVAARADDAARDRYRESASGRPGRPESPDGDDT